MFYLCVGKFIIRVHCTYVVCYCLVRRRPLVTWSSGQLAPEDARSTDDVTATKAAAAVSLENLVRLALSRDGDAYVKCCIS